MAFDKSQLLLMLVAVTIVASLAISEEAFAHGRASIPVTLPNGETRTITFVMGHSNEPTYAAEPGIHDGKHPLEVFLRDSATGLDISNADLKADKFFFRDVREFEMADSPDDARFIKRDVSVSHVFGDPGHFVTHQVHSDPGIYGYHVTGTISYFGVTEVPVDITAFCREAPSKFNSEGWQGGFGCTDNINDTKSPTKTGHRSGQFGNGN